MIHLDLFSGIGGFALASRWAGFETVQFVEIEPFCQKVLRKNFEGVPIHDDIKTFDATAFRGRITLLTGGFPCQPYSVAGKRQGETDDRALWGEMLRVIDECRPTWVVGENVTGILSMEIQRVLSDLEGVGYQSQVVVIPACAVNAPHRRDRVWVVAHSQCSRPSESDTFCCTLERESMESNIERGQRITNSSVGGSKALADSDSAGLQESRSHGDTFNREAYDARQTDTSVYLVRDTWVDIEPCVRFSNDGLSRRLARHNRDAVKALGNAIVPQVVYPILKEIARQQRDSER